MIHKGMAVVLSAIPANLKVSHSRESGNLALRQMSRGVALFVIPAQAGIDKLLKHLDSRLRGSDERIFRDSLSKSRWTYRVILVSDFRAKAAGYRN